MIERRDYVEADALVHGLQGPFNEAYQPLGWLTVDFDGISGPHNYERSLDLSEGVAAVRYEVAGSRYEREAFVSTPDRALIVHMSVRGPKRLNLEIALGSQHPSVSSYDDEGTLWLEGRAPSHVAPHYWPEEPAVVYDERSGLRFVAGVGLNVVGGAHRASSERVSSSGRCGGADLVLGRRNWVHRLPRRTRRRPGDTAAQLPRVSCFVCIPSPIRSSGQGTRRSTRHYSTGAGFGSDVLALSRPPPTNASKPCATAVRTTGCSRCCSTMVAIC